MPTQIEEVVVPVSPGDSILSLAQQAGHFWETLWNHSPNADLKGKRKDPNILAPGDLVTIPPIRVKDYSCATDQRHTFKRRGVPAKLKIQLFQLGEPRANEDYTLIIDDKIIQGKTDADGNIEHFIQPDAKGGKLLLNGGKEEYPVRIGHLNPIDILSGIKQRLNNLGYDCGDESDSLTPKLKQALLQFQADHKLPQTGEADAATKSKLESLHT